MRDGAFDALVTAALAGRTRRGFTRRTGLHKSTLTNMRDRATMPSSTHIAEMARVLDVPASAVTLALLQDRGYDIGGGDALSALAATAAGMTMAERRTLEQMAALILDLRQAD